MDKLSSPESLSPERNVRSPNNLSTLVTHAEGHKLITNELNKTTHSYALRSKGLMKDPFMTAQGTQSCHPDTGRQDSVPFPSHHKGHGQAAGYSSDREERSHVTEPSGYATDVDVSVKPSRVNKSHASVWSDPLRAPLSIRGSVEPEPSSHDVHDWTIKQRGRIDDVIVEDDDAFELRGYGFGPSHDKSPEGVFPSQQQLIEGVFPSQQQRQNKPHGKNKTTWSYDLPINKSHPNTRMECHDELNYPSYTKPLNKESIIDSSPINTTASEPRRLRVSDAQIIPHQGDVSRCAEGGNTGRSDIPGSFAKLCEDRRHDHASEHRGSDVRFAYICPFRREI